MPKSRLQMWLMAGLLALVTLALYWPVTGYDFVNYDDPVYFSENPHVLGGLTWSNLAWAFQTTLCASWYPVSWVSFMLDAELFGRGPAGPHLMNVLLHAANGVLLFLLWKRLAGSLWRSAFVAGLFVLHPLHVESVAWVSERKDVLSTFFGFLTLLAYARYAEGGGQKSEDRNRRPKETTKSEARSCEARRRGASRSTGSALMFSVDVRSRLTRSPIFYLLSSIFFLCLRLGLDEQADAGDVAVCDVAIGLLAIGENAECRMQNAECRQSIPSKQSRHTQHAVPPAPGKGSFPAPGADRKRSHRPRPQAGGRHHVRLPAFPCRPGLRMPLCLTPVTWGRCSGRRTSRFHICILGIGLWGRFV